MQCCRGRFIIMCGVNIGGDTLNLKAIVNHAVRILEFTVCSSWIIAGPVKCTEKAAMGIASVLPPNDRGPPRITYAFCVPSTCKLAGQSGYDCDGKSSADNNLVDAGRCLHAYDFVDIGFFEGGE